jgi:methyl-accepting chemotaxis protein
METNAIQSVQPNVQQEETQNDTQSKKRLRTASITATTIALVAVTFFTVNYFLKQLMIVGAVEGIAIVACILALIFVIRNHISLGMALVIYPIVGVTMFAGIFSEEIGGNGFTIIVFSTTGVYAAAIALAAFFLNRIHVLIMTGITIVYFIAISMFITDPLAKEHVVTALASLLVMGVVAFYFTGYYKQLITKAQNTAQQNQTSRDQMFQLIIKIRELHDTMQASEQEVSEQFSEIDRILKAYQSQIDTLNQEMGTVESELHENTSELNILTEAVGTISEKIESQSAHIAQNASAHEETVNSIQSITTNMEQVNSNHEGLTSTAEQGKSGVQSVIQSLNELEKYQHNMTDITSSIINISKQTHLLSMNASIEAAHAGDSGRGFAVVADEIRKLADETSMKTKTITDLIQTMSNQITNTVQEVTSVNNFLLTMSDAITETAPLIQETNSGLREQTSANKEVMTSIRQIIDITSAIRESASQEKSITENYKQRFHTIADGINTMKTVVTDLVQYTEQSIAGLNAINRIYERTQEMNEQIQTIMEQLDQA